MIKADCGQLLLSDSERWWAEPTLRGCLWRIIDGISCRGDSYFFTVVTKGRKPLFADATSRQLLGDLMRDGKRQWPFEINAIVLLPEHLHAIWSLPPGDAAYPRRWGWIKKEFTKAWLSRGGIEQPVSSFYIR